MKYVKMELSAAEETFGRAVLLSGFMYTFVLYPMAFGRYILLLYKLQKTEKIFYIHTYLVNEILFIHTPEGTRIGVGSFSGRCKTSCRRRNPCMDSRNGIHVYFFLINALADWFGQINKVIEHRL